MENIAGRDEIIDRLTLAYPKNELKKEKNVLSLDLSDARYQFNNLEELEKDTDYIQYFLHINSMNVNNNKLSTLKLKGFNYLEKIIASNNILSRIELNLPKLKKLDLSSNMLDKVPNLTQLPNIEELRLNKNSISKISYEDFKIIKATLNTLEISYNKINFDRPKEFFDFVEIFGRNMRKLRSINLQKNPFSTSKVYSKEYPNVLMYYCESLNAIDGKTLEESEKEMSKQINNIKNKIIENEKLFGINLKEESTRKVQYGIDKEKGVTITNIKRGIERYQTISRMGENSFRELKEIIEEYINNSKNNENNENQEQEEDDNEVEEYENFLESCNVVIENSSTLEKPLFDIVANFSVIKNGKFSDLSLTFFKHHLSSQEKAKQIEEVIQNTIISHINQQNVENIPASIISGLKAFTSESKFKRMILELVKQIRGIVESFKDIKILSTKSANFEDNKKRELLNVSFSFLALITEEEDVLEIMISSASFLDSISSQLKYLLAQGEDVVIADERALDIMINILNIIRSLCVNDVNINETATIEEKEQHENKLNNVKNILALGLKDKVEQILSKKLDVYTKGLNETNKNDSKKSDSKSKEIKLKARILLGNLIRCFGGLIRKIDDKNKLNFSNTSVPMTLLNLLPLPNFNDPLILSSICEFILYIFDNPMIVTNQDDLFSTLVSKLYSMRYVLQFLFEGPKYNQACIIADSLGQNTLYSGQPVEFENLASELMHKMFISIINLITFFGSNSQSGNINIQQTCKNVCSDLNEMERDNALTRCLIIPSDEVKKSVVNCLFYVNCDEFNREEIKAIYIQISNVNLMAGDIEEVIATIFIILSKAFISFMKESGQSNAKEKVEYNKDAFIIAYDLLSKNQNRLTHDVNESDQKEMLSIALVVFLINCSCFDNIKKFYSERKITTKVHRILNSEETKLNKFSNLPIEVEKTRAGWSIINLTECFKNEFLLYPYSYVTLRLMIHIADMMMNVPYSNFDIADNTDFSVIIEQLRQEILNREFIRVQREGFSFKEFIIEMKKNSKKSAPYEMIQLTPNEMKEEQHKFISLFSTILHFLLGKTSISKLAEFDRIWEDKFDPKFNLLSYSLTEIKITESKDFDIKVDENYLENEDIFNKLKRKMKEESIYGFSSKHEAMNEYDHIRYDMTKFFRYGSEKDKIKRFDYEETANNPYLRGLVIAAFLRSIWAVLEFPQEKMVKEQMIEILRKGNNIKDISLLVDSTKMVEFNIASKYLIIMRYVLSQSKVSKSQKKFNPQEETEYLNQIGVISYMIRKMLNVNSYNIKIDQEESKIFLSDLSKCAAVICNEVFNLHYSSTYIREKTMSSMVNYSIIKVLIKTVKDYVNKDYEIVKKELNSDGKAVIHKKKDQSDSDNEMVFTAISIISEFMSKCKEYSYIILESFVRGYIFDKLNIRKTLLKEIIEISKISDLKTKIETDLKIRIYFISRCIFYDFYQENELIIYVILTESGIEVLNVPNNLNYKEWELDVYTINEWIRVKYDDIVDVFELELNNRVILKTKKYLYGLLFLKTNLAAQFIEHIKFQNSNVNDYRNFKVFIEGDEQNEENEKNQQMFSFAFMCVVKENVGFFGMFSGLFKEREVLPNARILLLRGRSIYLYREDLEAWKFFNVDRHLKTVNGVSVLCELNKLFSYIREYQLDDLTAVTFVKANMIILNFDGRSLEIEVLDDMSNIKLKKIISTIAIEKKFKMFNDDIYESIK